MKAIVIDRYGSAQELHEMTLPVPEIKADEVLVKVAATSVNPIDWRTRTGQMRRDGQQFPLVLGWDVAGVISAVGAAVRHFQVGDAVFARSDHAGANAQYVAIKADKLAMKPGNLSFVQAAAVPLAGMTAFQVIIDQLQVVPGDRVLIQAGAGGVGLFAIQIAKAQGAYVITTASEANREMLLRLGADEVIDYHQTQITAAVHDLDAVFDTTNEIEDGLAVLKPTGMLVSIAGRPTVAQQTGQPSATHWWLHPSGKTLTQLGQLIAVHQVQVVIDSQYPFTTAGVRAAHERSESHHAHGKIVIVVDEKLAEQA